MDELLVERERLWVEHAVWMDHLINGTFPLDEVRWHLDRAEHQLRQVRARIEADDA
jgi:hypothetical protein